MQQLAWDAEMSDTSKSRIILSNKNNQLQSTNATFGTTIQSFEEGNFMVIW